MVSNWRYASLAAPPVDASLFPGHIALWSRSQCLKMTDIVSGACGCAPCLRATKPYLPQNPGSLGHVAHWNHSDLEAEIGRCCAEASTCAGAAARYGHGTCCASLPPPLRLGSARLGLLGSARLGSARLGSERGLSTRSRCGPATVRVYAKVRVRLVSWPAQSAMAACNNVRYPLRSE